MSAIFIRVTAAPGRVVPQLFRPWRRYPTAGQEPMLVADGPAIRRLIASGDLVIVPPLQPAEVAQ